MAKQPSYPSSRSQERRNRTELLAKSVGRLTKPVFGRRGMAEGTIARDWAAIVGDAIAKHSQPDRISYPNRERTGGLLHLRVDNSAMATQLQHLEPQLVERINGHFGYRAVARLRYIHGPLPTQAARVKKPVPPPTPEQARRLADTLGSVDDPDLRAALERLGRAMARRGGDS